MYLTKGLTQATDSYADLSFRHLEGWMDLPMQGDGGFNFVMLGDEDAGASLGFIAYPAGSASSAHGHAHASDNFRVSLLGAMIMGRESYGRGEFRFQDGWKPYPDEIVEAPDGYWGMVLMADRRGRRARYINPEFAASDEAAKIREDQKLISRTFGVDVDDCLSDDPAHTSGPSALATTLGETSNSGKLNGSFADQADWQPISPTTRAVFALLGEPTVGPILVLAATEPGQVAAARCRFDTEVLRLIIDGSCEVGGRPYERGDMRIQHAGAWCEPVVAGPDGLQEYILLGDRRGAHPELAAADDATWVGALDGVVAGLRGQLADAAA
jgi:hypothetical protein